MARSGRSIPLRGVPRNQWIASNEERSKKKASGETPLESGLKLRSGTVLNRCKDKQSSAQPTGSEHNNTTVGSIENLMSKATIKDNRRIAPTGLIKNAKAIPSLPNTVRGAVPCMLSSPREVLTFKEWERRYPVPFKISKVCETTAAQLYRFEGSDDAFKMIALQQFRYPRKDENPETGPDDPSDIFEECLAQYIHLLETLGRIPGFARVQNVCVTQGKPSRPLINAYRAWGKPSYFPDPAKKDSITEDQHWVVLEMPDYGCDLEQIVDRSEDITMPFIWDVFWQIVLSLKFGEDFAEFELRDLHLGNICIRESLDYDPRSTRKLFLTKSIITIIDFGDARMKLRNGEVIYQDLARCPSVFTGDGAQDYYHEILRLTRGSMLSNGPYADSSQQQPSDEKSTWQQFHPRSNLLWLHYILHELMGRTKAIDYLTGSLFKETNHLKETLLEVQNMLEPHDIYEGNLNSAGDLLNVALEKGCLDLADVEWYQYLL